jgi:hypothetical protein
MTASSASISFEDAGRELGVPQARFGQAHRAGGAVDQADADLPLQLGDVPRHERARRPQLLGRAAEAAGLRDGDEAVHEEQSIHDSSGGPRVPGVGPGGGAGRT